MLTLCGPVETNVELLHAVINEVDLVVRHQPAGNERSPRRQRLCEEGAVGSHTQFHDIGLDATLAGGTVEGSRPMSVHALKRRSPQILIMVDYASLE